jgi:hypothetical protein
LKSGMYSNVAQNIPCSALKKKEREREREREKETRKREKTCPCLFKVAMKNEKYFGREI